MNGVITFRTRINPGAINDVITFRTRINPGVINDVITFRTRINPGVMNGVITFYTRINPGAMNGAPTGGWDIRRGRIYAPLACLCAPGCHEYAPICYRSRNLRSAANSAGIW